MGELVKVKILANEAGVNINAQFNPKELQVDKSVSWTAKSGHDEDPEQEFKEPQAASLSCTLYFDTYEAKTDVYETAIKELEKTVKMCAVGRPPMTTFSWGRNFVFTGVVESLSQKYTMFLEDGKRVRCEVGFKMKSAKGATVAAQQGSNPTGT